MGQLIAAVPVQAPPLLVAVSSATPGGSGSVSVTSPAVPAPPFVTEMVYVTSSPASTVAGAPAFVTPRSAPTARDAADAELFAGFGSGGDPVAVTVLRIVAIADVRATITIGTCSPLVSVPSAHVTV